MRRMKEKPNNVRGRWLIARIKERKMTVFQVSKHIGISQKHFYRIVHKPMGLTFEQVAILSGVLNIPIRDILAWVLCSDAEIGKKDKYWFE